MYLFFVSNHDFGKVVECFFETTLKDNGCFKTKNDKEMTSCRVV